MLLCFRESDGKLLWKQRSPRLGTGLVEDFPLGALGSAPLKLKNGKLTAVFGRHSFADFELATGEFLGGGSD